MPNKSILQTKNQKGCHLITVRRSKPFSRQKWDGALRRHDVLQFWRESVTQVTRAYFLRKPRIESIPSLPVMNYIFHREKANGHFGR